MQIIRRNDIIFGKRFKLGWPSLLENQYDNQSNQLRSIEKYLF